MSRITIVTSGTRMIIEQIKSQLDRLVPVHRVRDLTDEGPHVERELALVKVAGTGDRRIESLRIADIFKARVVDATLSSFVFEMTGSAAELDDFIGLMRQLAGRGQPDRRRRDFQRRRQPVKDQSVKHGRNR